MPFELQKKFNIKIADTNKKILILVLQLVSRKCSFILKFTVCMIHINKEKLLADRERLLNILKNKDLDDQTHRLVREDLRNVEKELEEIDPELLKGEDANKTKK
ncbi:MAG: hypothetical protein OHK0045_04160 [Raineya sp.]